MKLRQKIALFLTTLYLTSVVGLAFSLHFCCGRLENVKLFSDATNCKFCKNVALEKKNNGCCQNTKVTVKVKDSHQTQASFKLPKLFSIQLFLHPPYINFSPTIFKAPINQLANKAPPKLYGVSLHIFNCIFRN